MIYKFKNKENSNCMNVQKIIFSIYKHYSLIKDCILYKWILFKTIRKQCVKILILNCNGMNMNPTNFNV